MSEAKEHRESDLGSSHCYSPFELASRVVEHWDNHDQFRATEADKALWGGAEPDDVVIARAFIKTCGDILAELESVASKLMPDLEFSGGTSHNVSDDRAATRKV